MTILAIDRPVHFTAPRWTRNLVCDRLQEAFTTERMVKGPRTPRHNAGSAWPAMAREFSDIVGWSDAARQAVWDDWSRVKVAFPYEVTRMEETWLWLRVLTDHPGELRCLVGWAMTRAHRKSIRKFVRQKPGWTRNTLYTRRNQGADRIADWLNSRGVMVR